MPIANCFSYARFCSASARCLESNAISMNWSTASWLAASQAWSIRTTFSWEPYIAISLKPGESKRWTYTYDYFATGEK